MISPAVLFRRLLARARLRHLQAMAAVAELGSIKQAAVRLDLTQPAVTQLIAELERLSDCKLFYRHDRGTRLTEPGAQLLPYVRDALSRLQEGVDQLMFSLHDKRNTVRVGAIEGAINGLLERALPEFTRLHAHIRVDVEEATAEQISALMAAKQADLLLVREPEVLPQDWVFCHLMDDELVAVCGPAHPLARRRQLAMDALRSEVWMLLPPSTEARQRFDENILDQATYANAYLSLQTRSFAIIQSMLKASRLLLLAPLSIVRQRLDSGQLKRLDLDMALPLRPIGVLIPVDYAQDSAAFVMKQYLADFCKER